jgi:MFS family permease
VRTYRELFAIREYSVLFVARSFVMLGVVVGNLALGTIVFQTTGSPLLTGIALFGGPLVQLVTSHFLLATADLIRPRTAMILVGLTSSVTDLFQLIPGLAWGWRFALVAVGYLVVSATSGTVMALVSDIVPADGFVLARSTMSVLVGGMQVIGNGIGGLLLLWFATTHLFVISASMTFLAVLIARFGLADHPPRAEGKIVGRTQTVNRILFGSRIVRPLYLTMWVPNGLIVGCEALFIPYAGRHGGYLFAAAAAGMLVGDLSMGRFVPDRVRDRLIRPLRYTLAIPYLAMILIPGNVVAALIALVASVGYCAHLPLQERLIRHTALDQRGQVFGLYSTGLMIGQAVGAIVAGALAGWLGHGREGVGQTMAILAVASCLVTLALAKGLSRSAPDQELTPSQALPSRN